MQKSERCKKTARIGRESLRDDGPLKSWGSETTHPSTQMTEEDTGSQKCAGCIDAPGSASAKNLKWSLEGCNQKTREGKRENKED